ncbi:DUF6311 domain-containing protein [Hominifimenecus sp. rT4P-3]|uniref:DUF6311 domain-containing protein n=1 Tax=Hominifimenecus sp. rT4P-3 TaxID=3242979 RepID=UPI003DA3D727
MHEKRITLSIQNIFQQKSYLFLSALLGAGIFCLIYGTAILDPTYVDWLYSGGDLSQHYCGWLFYRNDRWAFPFGVFQSLSYPDSMSIVFTDSIPIFAILFKLLSPILPTNFQYFGWWGILCFMMQGALGAFLIRKYTKRDITACAGSLLFVLSPIYIRRMFAHTALAGQWILLLALIPLIYYDETFSDDRRAAIYWWGIGALTASVHIYFIPMCGCILCGFLIKHIWEKKRVQNAVLILGGYLGSAALALFFLGAFSVKTEAAAGGLGIYSFNLNAFFNSREWSTWFPSLPDYTWEQTEGFAYLGFGVMVLCFAAVATGIVLWVKKILGRAPKSSIAAYTFIICALVFVAMSPVATIGSRMIYTLELWGPIEKLWSVFRSCGRFIWPVVYLIIIAAFAVLSRWKKKRALLVLLLLCTGLQIGEMKHMIVQRRETFGTRVTYESDLKDQAWEMIGKSDVIRHIVFGTEKESVYSFAEYASKYGMTLSDFAFSRRSEEETASLLKEQLDAPDRTELFVFLPSDPLLEQYDFQYYFIDGFVVGYVEKLEGLEPYELDKNE